MARFSRLLVLLAIAAMPAALFVIASRLPSENRGLPAGTYLPDSLLVTTTGETVRTHSWRGRPTLVVLFRAGCEACEEEIANLEALAPETAPLRIALVSVEPSCTLECSLPVYLDPTGEFLRRTERLMVPVLYWVSPMGRIQYVRTGLRSFQEDAALLHRLLEGTPKP